MSDFSSEFWSFYIGALTVVGLLACVALLMFNNQRKAGQVELHGKKWDEDLEEWDNPLPRWWLWLFYLTIFFAVFYLVLYPGLGSYEGKNAWTSQKQYDSQVQQANQKYGPIFAKYSTMDLRAVAADPQAREIGERLFVNYCAQCHGSDAGGAKGFPSLRDSDWLYGGAPEQIKTSISEGRHGVMPAFGTVLGAEGVKDVMNYVRSLSGLPADSIRKARGGVIFKQNCVACHGAEGKGNPMMGAPNLSDRIWLYGGSETTLIETITQGRSNRMPAHAKFLGDEKVHVLAAYVLGLPH